MPSDSDNFKSLEHFDHGYICISFKNMHVSCMVGVTWIWLNQKLPRFNDRHPRGSYIYDPTVDAEPTWQPKHSKELVEVVAWIMI